MYFDFISSVHHSVKRYKVILYFIAEKRINIKWEISEVCYNVSFTLLIFEVFLNRSLCQSKYYIIRTSKSYFKNCFLSNTHTHREHKSLNKWFSFYFFFFARCVFICQINNKNKSHSILYMKIFRDYFYFISIWSDLNPVICTIVFGYLLINSFFYVVFVIAVVNVYAPVLCLTNPYIRYCSIDTKISFIVRFCIILNL